MKRVAADQSIIDQAIALQAQGKTDAEIARELGVVPATPSNWRKQGRLPEKPQRKTNGGKVREYEPLPKLQPGQRLDGTPEPKKEEKPRMIEVERAQVVTEAKEPVTEKKSRITRSVTLRGGYLTVDCEPRGLVLTVDVPSETYLTTRDMLEVLMDIETEAHELISEVEKLL